MTSRQGKRPLKLTPRGEVVLSYLGLLLFVLLLGIVGGMESGTIR